MRAGGWEFWRRVLTVLGVMLTAIGLLLFVAWLGVVDWGAS